MDFLNLQTTELRAPEFSGASAFEAGVWLKLQLHCVAVENLGVIPDCRHWTDRQWLSTVGIEAQNVKFECSLWWFEDDDLHVWNYPHLSQSRVEAAREGGKKGGRPRKQNPPENPVLNPPENHGGNLKGKSKDKDKGKENERGMERECAHAHEDRSAPVSVDEAQEWATSYSKGNAEGIVIEPAWVSAWFDHRDAAGWIVVRNGVEIPIAKWQSDLRSWCRSEKLRGNPPPHSRSGLSAANGEKKEKGPRPADFPWRTVAIVIEGWTPEGTWEQQTARSRSQLREVWDGLSPERRAELQAMETGEKKEGGAAEAA